MNSFYHKILTGLFFLGMASSAAAQLPKYFVYSIKGGASVKKPERINTVTLKQQDLLFDNDLLVCTKTTEITLIDKDANYLVVNGAGSFKIDFLSINNRKATAGLTNKFFTLLWHELIDPHYDYTAFRKENLTKISGSVLRGECDNLIFPVEGLTTSTTFINCCWRQTNDNGEYDLFIYKANKELFKLLVRDTQATVNIASLGIPLQGKFYWLVKSHNDSVKKDAAVLCEIGTPVSFNLVSKANEEGNIKRLTVKNSDDDLLAALQTIDNLEHAGFLYAAKNELSQLEKRYPNKSVLRKSYIFFLLKYGFNKEAAAAWR